MEDQVVNRQHSHNSGLLKYRSEMGDRGLIHLRTGHVPMTAAMRPCAFIRKGGVICVH